MSLFMYRWRYNTIHKNVYYFCFDFINGIWNIIRWAPVIWKDQDFAWDSLAIIMEYKLKRMSVMFKNCDDQFFGTEKAARELLICAEILRRLREDYAEGVSYAIQNQRMKEMEELLGKIIGRKMRSWWI